MTTVHHQESTRTPEKRRRQSISSDDGDTHDNYCCDQRNNKRMTGYYADPLSPIASTPMKRSRTKAENTKSAKPKHAPTPATNPTTITHNDESFLSPRTLLNEYDDEVNINIGLKIDTIESSSKSVKLENTPSSCASKEVDNEMFSPTLKGVTHASNRSSKVEDVGTPDIVPACNHQVAQMVAHDTDGQEEDTSAVESDDTFIEEEFNPFLFIKSLPKYTDLVPVRRPSVLPEKTKRTPDICLVLDLDETLVHCTVEEVEFPHLQFPVTFHGMDYTVNVKKRPHMEYFLKRVAEQFEVVVFTASHRSYAEKLLNLLDPSREFIKYRLYREDCLDVDGNYLKDLNVLGRQLSKVVLVDNSPHAFGYQVSNGIPIETWYDDEADDELLNLLPFLESLVGAHDVRPIVERQFQMQKLIDSMPVESR